MSDHPEGMDHLLGRVRELHERLPVNLSFLEVGSYQGETTCDIIRILRGSERWLFTVDPYGSKPYLLDGQFWAGDQTLYTDHTYRRAIRAMATAADEHAVNHAYYRMTSLDFFEVIRRFDFWYRGEIFPLRFGFVYLDGAHEPATVRKEVEWLREHMREGLIVVDDWHHVADLPFRGEVLHDRCYLPIG